MNIKWHYDNKYDTTGEKFIVYCNSKINNFEKSPIDVLPRKSDFETNLYINGFFENALADMLDAASASKDKNLIYCYLDGDSAEILDHFEGNGLFPGHEFQWSINFENEICIEENAFDYIKYHLIKIPKDVKNNYNAFLKFFISFVGCSYDDFALFN